MGEGDPKRLLQSLLPRIVAVLAGRGSVRRKPSAEEPASLGRGASEVCARGRQDVEARLWQDPFSALSLVAGAASRAAIEDRGHHLETLSKSIRYAKSLGRNVTFLAVMLPGGPYSEDSESRRRFRYAVVSALFNLETAGRGQAGLRVDVRELH